jgi:hypothetical protein
MYKYQRSPGIDEKMGDPEARLIASLEKMPLMLASTMKSVFQRLCRNDAIQAYESFTTNAVAESKLLSASSAGHKNNGPLWIYVKAPHRDAFKFKPTIKMVDRFKQLPPPDCSRIFEERFKERRKLMHENNIIQMNASKRKISMISNSHMPKDFFEHPAAAAATAATSGDVQSLAQDDEDDEARYDLALSVGVILYDPMHVAVMTEVYMHMHSNSNSNIDTFPMSSTSLTKPDFKLVVNRLCDDMFMTFIRSKNQYEVTLARFLDACTMKAREAAAAAAAGAGAGAEEDARFLEELQAKIDASLPKITKRLRPFLKQI